MNKFEIMHELCKLAEIRTFEDLRCFQKDYAITRATPTAIIIALTKEVMIRIKEGKYE